MKSKNHELKIINKIDVSKTIKSIKMIKHFLLLLVTVTLLISCSSDDSVTPEATTLIPDPNFEQALIDLGIDTNGLDGTILNSDAENVTELPIYFKEISDLTGINAFTNLESLDCEGNYLTNLDISKLDVLKTLVCGNNDIESINFSEQSSLEHISCGDSLLTSLNVSTSPNLRYLMCAKNEITALDLSVNTELVHLVLSRNNLTEIDLSNNLLLENLYASGNNLDHLDLSANNMLKKIFVDNNQLQEFFFKNGNNTGITNFSAKINPNLTCIEVDNPNYSNYNWGNVDPQTTFLVNCN